MPRCKACGDPAVERGYCKECADEVFRGVIDTTPARLFSSGAGCPLEGQGSEDPSPGEENAVRVMEG